MAVINFEVSKNTTNGDVFKELFPDVDVQEIRGHFGNTLLGYRTQCGGRSQDYLLDWWNAPYKTISKDDMDTEHDADSET